MTASTSQETEGAPCFTAPSPARMKEISLESTMWWAPSSRRNRTPEILCPLRGPFSQASLKPCSMMGKNEATMTREWEKKDFKYSFGYVNLSFHNYRGDCDHIKVSQTFSTAGTSCFGTLVPTVWSSNSSLVKCSGSRGSRTPITLPYCPEPPLCFLWVKSNLQEGRYNIHQLKQADNVSRLRLFICVC